MRRCPACGAEAADSENACATCGAELERNTASLPPTAIEIAELAEPIEPAEVPLLVVRKGPEVGEKFYLDRPMVTIGRDPDADIFLNDITVSRRHATLRLGDGTVVVQDEGSLNGTYVNGMSIDKAALGHGDTLQVGRFQMVFLAGRS